MKIDGDDKCKTILIATEMIDGVMKRYDVEEYDVLARSKERRWKILSLNILLLIKTSR